MEVFLFFIFLIMKEKWKFCFCKWGGKFFFVIRNRRGKYFFVQWKVKKEIFVVVFCVFEKWQMFFYFLFISMAVVFLQRNHVFVLILIFFYKWIK